MCFAYKPYSEGCLGYGTVWKPRIGEILSCSRKGGNRDDPFAVGFQKSSTKVGHVPRRISCICSLFLRQLCAQLLPVKG